jgi:two-component system, LytTR family, response regulator AlgR
MSAPPRLLIVDDEPPARARLRALVEAEGLGVVVGEAAHGVQALAEVGACAPDVLLLDIRMPGMDGLEVARHLTGMPNAPAVVFTTAFDEHALAAFDAGAVDYLLKPVRVSRLVEALTKARRLLLADFSPELAERRSHLSATLNGELRIVAVDDVRLLRAEHKYLSVHHTRGVLVVDESLAALEEEFAESFVRVHRNALVSVRHVLTLRRAAAGTQVVSMADCNEAVEVSRRLVPAVRRILRKM